MKPYYDKDGITIYCGDCLEVMKDFEDGSFDLVLTDPPYGLDFKGSNWDKFIPSWIGEAKRMSNIIMFTTAPTTMWDYPRPDWVLCWYREAAQSRSQLKGGFNHWSPILCYGKPKFWVDSIKLHAIQHRSDGIDHPSPKPIALMEWLVRNASNENNIILDPFMGSGTTLVAAKKLGRKAVGIEISEKYCEIAVKRLETLQENLL